MSTGYAQIWNRQPVAPGEFPTVGENELRGNVCGKCRGRLTLEPMVTRAGQWLGRLYVMQCLACGNESRPFYIAGRYGLTAERLIESARMAAEAQDNHDRKGQPITPAAWLSLVGERGTEWLIDDDD